MAFAITNKTTTFPTEFVPVVHKELADQTSDITALDMGVAGLKFLRGRIVAKSGIDNTETFSFLVRLGATASLNPSELVYVSPTYTGFTTDTRAIFNFYASSELGFQYVNVDVTNAGTWTFDVILEAA